MRAKTYEKILGLLIEDKEFRKMYRRNPVVAVNNFGICVNKSELDELLNHHKN